MTERYSQKYSQWGSAPYSQDAVKWLFFEFDAPAQHPFGAASRTAQNRAALSNSDERWAELDVAAELFGSLALSDDRVDPREVAEIVVLAKRHAQVPAGRPSLDVAASLAPGAEFQVCSRVNYMSVHVANCIPQALFGPDEPGHARPPGS